MHHVILGAGPAGVIAAETLRKAAPADTITLVGGEAEAPYSRMAIPYLIAGNVAESGTHLRHGSDHFKQLRIAQFLRISIGTPEQNAALIEGLSAL